ncbi:MAG: 2-amino-4-hydroxy-6-hydroxymethyldihydropteridine diphosphokinase, partial [Clostridia bacterium]|nr:2-amino-4-hydroxy-6-hydroxymethyldihydropteridine diphosphokinase [Clostridia bacterium]
MFKQNSKQAYIALGSNMGNAAENLNRAVWALSTVPGIKVTAVSKVYETEPVGYKKQDNFLNAVVRVESELSPQALLGACLGIEAGMGRIRKIKNGPRVIDLDLLLYEDATL